MATINPPDDVQALVHRFASTRPSSNFARWESDLYQQLISCTSFLPKRAPIMQRLWYVERNTDTGPKCHSCDTHHHKWNNADTQHKAYCGIKCANSAESAVEKRKATNTIKYGVASYTQTNTFKQQRVATSQHRYGTDYPIQHPSVKQQSLDTIKQRYGNPNYTQTDDYRAKTSQMVRDRYDRDYVSQRHIDPNALRLLSDGDWLYQQHVTDKRTITSIASQFNIDTTTVVSYCNIHGIAVHRHSTTMWEYELAEFLDHNGIRYVQNDRTVLNGKELDAYLPDHNIAIELCGLYWHSDIHDRIDKHTHSNKQMQCRLKGIQLLTIFEDEWNTNKSLIFNSIKHRTGRSIDRCYARKTNIVSLDTKQKTWFFDQYHIQGNGPSSINYALVLDDRIVAVIGFIRTKNGNTILNRYATTMSVVGGFTKLLKYHIKYDRPGKITTFADLRWSVGDLYTNTGFDQVANLPPDYSYIVNNTRYHKFGFRRKHLPRKLRNFDPDKTERQNCDDNNVLRIWDCGKIKYELVTKYDDTHAT